jgi:hypothetical protein
MQEPVKELTRGGTAGLKTRRYNEAENRTETCVKAGLETRRYNEAENRTETCVEAGLETRRYNEAKKSQGKHA